MNFTETLQRAKPGSMVDVRSPDNQIDSFRVEDVLGAMVAECEPVDITDALLFGRVQANMDKGMDAKDAVDAVLGPWRPIPFQTK